ncbi:MAG: hypothetical protein P8X65_03660 [Syntrophobacterales bacterium]|jgi:hypothetical protein
MNYGEKVPSVLCCLLLSLIMGCNLPFSPAPPLTTAEARHTLDHWNPNYCQVKEFYGWYQPAAPDTRLAYVLLINPKDPAAKPVLSVARFQLLTRPDGSQEWFLTSLLSHSQGLSLRQGWDNLLIPVKIETPKVVE